MVLTVLLPMLLWVSKVTPSDDELKSSYGIEFEMVSTWGTPSINHSARHMAKHAGETNSYIVADGSTITLFYSSPGQVEIRENNSNDKQQLITGFAQPNSTHLLLVISNMHCLRWLDIDTSQETVAAGKCGKSGNRGGHPLDSKFSKPHQAVVKPINEAIYLTDTENRVIKYIDFRRNVVEPFVPLNHRPYGLYKDSQFLFVTTSTRLIRINIETKHVSYVIPSAVTGMRDGSLRKALLNHPYGMLKISEDLMLLADTGNNRLRVVDFEKRTVSSICGGIGTSTTLERCQLDPPLSLLNFKPGTILIGGESRTVKMLTYYEHEKEGESGSTESQPDNNTRHSSQSSLTPLTITVIIIVGGLVFIVLIIAVFCIVYKKCCVTANITKADVDNRADIAQTSKSQYNEDNASSHYSEIAEDDDYQSLHSTNQTEEYTGLQLDDLQNSRNSRTRPLPHIPSGIETGLSNEKNAEIYKYYVDESLDCDSKGITGGNSEDVSTLSKLSSKENLRPKTSPRFNHKNDDNTRPAYDYGYIDFEKGSYVHEGRTQPAS